MTDDLPASAEAARETLSATRRLTQRVRRAQRGTWFPLVLLGLAVIAAVPVYRSGRHEVACDPAAGARGGVQIIHEGTCVQVVGRPVGVYWLLAFVLAYAAIAVFYAYRARARGVGTRVLPYAGCGLAAGLVSGIVAAWARQLDLDGYLPTGPVAVAMVPLVSIGLSLFVLALVERNRPLMRFAVGYLVVALLACGVGARLVGLNLPAIFGPTWGFLPALLVAGGVLLLGGAGFAVAERRGA
jgi:hypothetical protein